MGWKDKHRRQLRKVVESLRLIILFANTVYLDPVPASRVRRISSLLRSRKSFVLKASFLCLFCHIFFRGFKSIKTHQRKQPSSGDRSIAQNSAYNRIKTQMYGCAVNLKPSFLCIPLFTLSRPQQILSWVWLNHGGARGRNINKLFHFINQPKAVWKMINFLFAGAAIAGVLVPSNRTCFNARSSSARRMAERSRPCCGAAPPGKNGH